ncbi:growth hormone receptor [Austrofundulus limnaeus]|uniref:Growth hormone receptor n=1 Tax=Austrofundulus limnaeus TaxID=52670 RepID=A0A2I4CN49_AUSLI|nr:PREDICTED: growth hormone receptor [Austrofundulus limnaeus]
MVSGFLLHTCSSSPLEPEPPEPEPVFPHLTSCVSSSLETFHCRWTAGTFQNLSAPGQLRLFYFNRITHTSSQKNWSECPHYSTERPNECFFSENYTSVWTFYNLQLRSQDQTVLYDQLSFVLSDIVQPDPPVALNWTLLNSSQTKTHFDVMLRWRPPRSADVETGWMALQYEVQYRSEDSDQWETMDLVKSTQRSLFGLQNNLNYQVRVRCKMLGGKLFGEFSDSVFIHVPSKAVSRFPLAALLIFGAFCLVAVLMLVIITQQQKLMFILLPPVPGPKIRGIDSDLLKRGKLRELTSILGGPADLRPELYSSDPWVEFIDLDLEERSDKLTDLDTDCLVGRSGSSALSGGFRDDDSGRSSCCEPELLCESSPSPVHPLNPDQIFSKEAPLQRASGSGPGIQGCTTGEPSLAALSREVLYTLVSEVRSGTVLLSPEDTDNDMSKQAQLHRDYTPERSAGKTSSESCRGTLSGPLRPGADPGPVLSPQQELHPSSAPVYTVVDSVDKQNSLVLTSNPAPPPRLTLPKPVPTPDGYLTPDLLGSVTP